MRAGGRKGGREGGREGGRKRGKEGGNFNFSHAYRVSLFELPFLVEIEESEIPNSLSTLLWITSYRGDDKVGGGRRRKGDKNEEQAGKEKEGEERSREENEDKEGG
jgi:hypothetical protein